MNQFPRGNKKILNAWAFYDWANSVYSLVIASSIFPIFYGALTIVRDDQGNILNDSVRFGGFEVNNDSLISYVTALAFLIVAVISPFLSGIADYLGNKKVFLKFFCYLGAISCIGLFWFNLEDLWFGLLCYLLALIGFWASLVFYNSYLPDLAPSKEQDKWSARGFSYGYVGSVILLVVCLILILNHEVFGFSSEEGPTRLSFVLTGLWWLGFSQYTFYHLPTGRRKRKLPRQVVFNGYRELRHIWLEFQESRNLKMFLQAFFVYSMAVQTVMLVATYFGIEEIDWTGQNATTGLIVSILLIQLVAIAGAILTSKSSGIIGNINTLIILNLIWVGICVAAFFITSPMEFYALAGCVGLVMGGIQSLSRSTYSKMLPEKTLDTTSYFSFYDVAEKIGIVIGMLLYGIIVQLTGSIRFSLFFLVLFFTGGILLLWRIERLPK